MMENPYAHDFLREALWVGWIIGTVCAVLSCYLVLKGWSLMGDAISHAVLPGVVLAYLAGLPILFGAFVAGMVCALLSGYLKANSRIKEDAVLGIVFTGLFAFGLVLFSKTATTLHLDHILFGNILGLEPGQVERTLWTGGLMLLILVFLRRDLLLLCFDPLHARSLGMRTQILTHVLLALIAAAVVLSMEAVGILLVVAMLITPGCTGFLLSPRFEWMMLIAVASTWVAFTLGIAFSFWLNASTSACIVLVQSGIFAGAWLLGPRHGLLWRRQVQRV
ncbi:MAG: metal ABC transporter permease [Blastochloris sp.]|nr:metal ABC transporter permease [Blastochloris sp.]